LVSIIIPSFNQGMFIRETIASCLTQDYRPLEIVVVDGASTDGTLAVLHEFDQVPEVSWISEPDKGVADAVNKGLASAKGEYAGIQSSDDAYLPGAVAQAVQELDDSPTIGLVYGNWIYIDASGKELKRYAPGPYSLENFLSGATIIPQHASFFRLALARELGGWNPEYYVADTEMWLRMLFRTEARRVDAYWGVRRMHEQQRNAQAFKIVQSHRRMLEESPDLKKAGWRLRMAAQCGKHLMAASYSHVGDTAVRQYHLWRALIAFPEIRKSTKILGQLIPGYWQFCKFSTRARRAVGKINMRAVL